MEVEVIHTEPTRGEVYLIELDPTRAVKSEKQGPVFLQVQMNSQLLATATASAFRSR